MARSLVAYICPECGEQIFYKNKWGSFGHYHTEGRDWPRPGDPWIKAISIPVYDQEELDAEIDSVIAAYRDES